MTYVIVCRVWGGNGVRVIVEEGFVIVYNWVHFKTQICDIRDHRQRSRLLWEHCWNVNVDQVILV